MTEQQAIAAENAARYTREDIARRIANRAIINVPAPKSSRYDNYLVLMSAMRKRAYNGNVSNRDLRTIAQGNAGDKLRAGRMMLAYLEG